MTDHTIPVVRLPQSQVQAAVNGFFKGMFLNELEAEDRKGGPVAERAWRAGGLTWLKGQLSEAVLSITMGDRGEKMIRKAIRDEIHRMLAGRTTGGANRLQQMVEAMVQKEVQAIVSEQVRAKLKVGIEIDIDPARYEKGAQF